MPKITYYNGSTDAYSGQVNMEAAIYVDGQIVGAAEYVLYDGELTISDIQVRPEWRRKGMGSRLIKYIKQENPEYKYVPSLKTELGSEFVHKDLPLDERAKAKFVYESIDFERGKSPKEIMGIGLKTIDVNYLKLGGVVVKDPPFIRNYLTQYLPDAIKMTDENPTMSPGVSFVSAEAEGKSEMTLYYLWYNKYNGVFYDGEYYSFGNYKKLQESLDFERGVDPKKTMGIGRSLYCKELYDSFIKDLRIAFPDLSTTFLKEDEIEGYYIELPLDPYTEEGMNLLDRITRKVIREKYKGKLVFITENFLEKYYKGNFPEESPFYGEEDLMIKIL